jgi:hypothetical protein
MKGLFKWAFKPQDYYINLDMISHLEDDYYQNRYKPSKELTRFYLAQV